MYVKDAKNILSIWLQSKLFVWSLIGCYVTFIYSTLYIMRPILNFLKATLGGYLNLGIVIIFLIMLSLVLGSSVAPRNSASSFFSFTGLLNPFASAIFTSFILRLKLNYHRGQIFSCIPVDNRDNSRCLPDRLFGGSLLTSIYVFKNPICYFTCHCFSLIFRDRINVKSIRIFFVVR